jgi:predicted Zn-dependent protease
VSSPSAAAAAPGSFDAAEEGLKIALAVRPDDPTTVMFLGQSALYRHRYAEADDYHARALAIDGAHTWSLVFYPVIPLYAGALADAERKLASAREVKGDDPWLTSCEALLCAKRGEAAKAEQLLACALRGKPLFHTHHMWHTAAATYALLGKSDRALSLLERAAAFGLPNYTLFRDDPHDAVRFLLPAPTLGDLAEEDERADVPGTLEPVAFVALLLEQSPQFHRHRERLPPSLSSWPESPSRRAICPPGAHPASIQKRC